MTRLIDEVRGLLQRLAPHVSAETAEMLRTAEVRLNEPLRVAIAGRVKSGKSTMLNAVIGQAAAATDAAECTRTVTWYVDGTTYRAHAVRRDGTRGPVPYRRSETDAHVDLASEDIDAIDRVEVEFPSGHLQKMTLIDTPGIASVSEQVSARASDFLLPEHGDQGADVVVYLLRHVHERDADFFEAFTDPAVAPVGAVRSVAVLSRADELGSGRGDSLQIAALIAQRYASHPVLRTRVADVMPVAGLLAFAAGTLTEAEFTHLRQLVGLSQAELDRLFVSADRFVAESPRIAVSADHRRLLVDRFGLFGVRLATSLIRSGRCGSAAALAQALDLQSGIGPLRRTLLDRFASRADSLKAARAIDLVAAIAARLPSDDGGVRSEVERITVDSHELAELRCMAQLLGDDDALPLNERTHQNALAALGNDGAEPWHRLRVDSSMPPEELLTLALERVKEFRTAALAPYVDRRAAEVLGVAVRSMEALHFQLAEMIAGESST